ncbi:MAG: transcription termination/antitermination protein NusG [Nitrospirae bacterium]|nr:transcription termination/antitermination protein NusG [Nitrospirota bacterium]
MSKAWYVVHTYSGFEGKVKSSIEERAKSAGLTERVGQILVPTEEVVELRNGKKRTSNRKFFPGYILVEMEMDDETWHLVKDTPKVTGFVGDKQKPPAITEEEVDLIRMQMDEGTTPAKREAAYSRGDSVRIVDGPFVSFTGSVEEVNLDQGKLKVMVSIFGRATPVELDFLQVEKA